ncbi:inositol monophosphatase family protein [Litoribrevibacter euphylliae]|uniref:Inositol monophosphatase family protein n=1 Tax=Litoribrevibacter euphylliae TaxID=1834034 RepID=A0ABV7HCA8_9GAMM
MHPYLNNALRAARRAAESLVSGQDRLDSEIREGKPLASILPSYLRHAEQQIIRLLAKSYPEHYVVGQFDAIGDSTAQYRWEIQILDSQTQYIRQIPSYALAVTYYFRDVAEHSVIINPATLEEFTASKGRGAQSNGRRIRFSDNFSAAGKLVSGNFLNGNNIEVAQKLKENAYQLCDIDSPLLAMAYAASGKAEAAIVTGAKTKLDAAVLIAKEAGALVGDSKGAPRPGDDTLVASPRVFKQVVQSLKN